ncbi:hypothetical protein TNCV_138011 [Trichonephila clavipes]|nr:hypothetical protein TNCV_138011 [Trichonephila clavipes]
MKGTEVCLTEKESGRNFGKEDLNDINIEITHNTHTNTPISNGDQRGMENFHGVKLYHRKKNVQRRGKRGKGETDPSNGSKRRKIFKKENFYGIDIEITHPPGSADTERGRGNFYVKKAAHLKKPVQRQAKLRKRKPLC